MAGESSVKKDSHTTYVTEKRGYQPPPTTKPEGEPPNVDSNVMPPKTENEDSDSAKD